MPKYLVEASYTEQGLQGVRDKGAKSRVDAVGDMIKGLGGTMESFYFAFGDTDAYVTAELPDDESAAAVALTVSASGAVRARTVKLLEAAQIDDALGRSVTYRPPGS